MINVNSDQLCEICKADPRKRPSECSEECKKKHRKKNYRFICQYCGEIGYTAKKDQKCHGYCSGLYRSKVYIGTNSPNWKGGEIEVSKGYIKEYCPNHLRATKDHPYVFQHILIMERAIGRLLSEGEIVHHINFIKNDNRIENLQLKLKVGHDKFHGKIRKLGNRVIPLQVRSKNSLIRWDFIYFPKTEYEPNYFPSARMF